MNANSVRASRLVLGMGASALALGCSMPALAQVEEIVVTAQKVEENVQDVPIAITAITGDRLAETGTTSLENIGDLVPSVTFRKGTTSANSAIIMRGVGTITFSVAAEPSVSTVVDGVVLSRSGQAFADLLDIERLEVLRGPQGTLFGKNASAGLVSIISKGGTDTLEADLRAEYFEGNEYRLRTSVSGPLSGDWSGRVTGFYGSYDGNIRNVFFDEDVNGYEHYGARGIVDYKGDKARLRLIADYFRANDDCCADVTGATRGAVLDAELGFPVALGTDQRTVNHNLITETKDKQWSLTSNLDLDVFDTHTLSVILGYRNWQNTEIREGDFLPRAIVGTAQLHDNGFVETGQYSAEVRLASDPSEAFFYQIGAFYWHSDNKQDFTRRDIVCASSTLPVAPSGARPCNLTDTVNTTFPTATSMSDVDSTNFAVFGQSTYRFTDQLSVTGGLRWTRDELDYTHIRAPGVNAVTGLPLSGPGVSGNPAGGTIASGGNGTNTSAGSSTNDNISGKASVQFEPSEDFLFYGSYTRGYKGPAFNVFFNHTAPNNAVPIDEETSDAFEIGMKSQFWDRRIQLNTALFQATYDGFQANNFILLNGTTITNLTNAGTVRTKGFEVDAVVAPVDGLTLRGSVAYADAKVREFNPNPITGAADARNGTRLPLAPEWSWNVGADYETPVGEAFKIYASTSFSYTGSQFSDLGEGGPIDSYGIWNASLGIGTADDLYRLTLHARNITDESYALLNVGNGQRYQIPRDADRYFGVTLSAKIR
ncbi:TonB-dependent receptor [Altererythrobacter confluentis]|uniref:TonB-dependent receptor n=1 Tax=Allopontixanthobacter confluentis TaxID=1849021 RepID=A0A6L7GDJ0_9SPHN|nr:TonB-dependent receptor [Allopontixanthobacter confluentis]MXP13254.1 TonB-dependent receptor [Allopontixanthobacter confluentis]